MKKVIFTGLALILSLALTGVPAQAGEEMSGFSAEIIANLEETVGKVIDLAEAIPAEEFGWRPNVEVRTVSRVYAHIAGVNLVLPSFLGADLPEGLEVPEAGPFALLGQWETEITEKDAVVAKLKESLEYVKNAVPQITDLDTEVQLFGPEPRTKRAYLMILMAHAHEHLGQSIAYARSMGIVPPWNAQQDADGGGDGGDGDGDSDVDDSDGEAGEEEDS